MEGVPTTFQTPLSGHFCPVEAVVPIGALDTLIPLFSFICIAFCVAIQMSGLGISFQEASKVIFYKSDYGHALTEIRCVCGIGRVGSVIVGFKIMWRQKKRMPAILKVRRVWKIKIKKRY